MSLLNNTIDITGTNNFNPYFNWQVGTNSFPLSDLRFRATIRPLSNNETNNRIPSDTVLYEETGIILNNENLGSWNFSLDKNILATNGPVRSYQVVIEAHDLDGNTSAGNTVGTSSENGWNAYPYGYDIIAINNPRPTGIELSNNVRTETGNGLYSQVRTGNYSTRQFIGTNGEIIISFLSGQLDSDLAGAFLYTSYAQFPVDKILTGDTYWANRVQTSRCDFNPRVGFLSSPHGSFDIRGSSYGYISVAFYDKLDEIRLNNGMDITTGMYVSNNALIYGDAAGGTLSLGGTNTLGTIITTGNPSPSRTSGLLGNATEIKRTYSPVELSGQNIEAVTTTILYMSIPINSYYTGADARVVLGSQYLDKGGLGGDSVSYPWGTKNPGGFYSGHVIPMANNTFKFLKDIQVGDSVKSFTSKPAGTYDRLTDNWEAGTIDPYNGLNSTGIVTKIHRNVFTSYSKISLNSYHVTGSPECFFINGYYAGIPTSQFLQIPNTNGYFNNEVRYNYRESAAGIVTSTEGDISSTVATVADTLTLYHLEVEPYKNFSIVFNSGVNAGPQLYWYSLYVHDAIQNY